MKGWQGTSTVDVKQARDLFEEYKNVYQKLSALYAKRFYNKMNDNDPRFKEDLDYYIKN
jgi:hypothetical protein